MTPASLRAPRVWLQASLLIAVLGPIIILNNYHYIFRYDLYEFEDLAADSLQIFGAKSFHELYGQYSRWGFHHPGPAFFYVQGWGEMLFHDWWHLVPRPLNAQMLTTSLMNVCFLSVALATATQWVGVRTIFLPLALGLAMLQIVVLNYYGPEFSGQMLFGTWPAYFLVIPFAALLLAVASVAAGRGQSLPFAALVGCFLVHGHIAQGTFFVLPFCTVAYAGLMWNCHRDMATAAGGEPQKTRWAFLTQPWKEYRRAHILTALIVVVFLVPILIDLTRGSHSNFAQIIAVRRATAGEPHKTLLRSLLYFLQFGGNEWYHPLEGSFDTYTAHGCWDYLAKNRLVWGFRVVIILGTLAVMASWLRRREPAAEEGAADLAAQHLRRRYIMWTALFTLAAVAMTLVWGCLMNGEMYYLNAYFNFAIYYVGTLVAAATAADFLCSISLPGWNGRGLRGFLYVAVAVIAGFNASAFRLKGYAHSEGLALIANNVAAAIRQDPAGAPQARYLSFYTQDVALAVQVVLQLERAGHPVHVAREWRNFMGEDRVVDLPVRSGEGASGNLPFLCWRIVRASDVPPGVTARPLYGDLVLMTGYAPIDPAARHDIRFEGPAGNEVPFTIFGWSDPEPGHPSGRLTDGMQAMLGFVATPVPAGSNVHVVFECNPFILPDKKPVERMGVNFNGTELGSWRRTSFEPIEVTIPAAAWNARKNAWLLLSFPDAASPASLGLNGDGRTVAFGFYRVAFRVEPTAAATAP